MSIRSVLNNLDLILSKKDMIIKRHVLAPSEITVIDITKQH